MNFLAWLEQTGPSLWVRETPSIWAFPFILYLHTLGLAMLAGLKSGLDLWLLTAKARPRPGTLENLYRIMWLGFGVNALSGVALLIAYPAKALTNPLFYAKLVLVAVAMVLVERQRRALAAPSFGPVEVAASIRVAAVVSLLVWAGTTAAGRLLAYTHSILLAVDGF